MDPAIPPLLARRFEAIVFDWDGTAVPDRHADATRMRRLVEDACAAGLELVVVSGTHVGNVDDQLTARPAGPGGLVLALNRGSEVFRVDRDGPQLVYRRTASTAEDAALSRAAQLTVKRLAVRGLAARIVSERLNRRKIDLIPVPGWEDPPEARIGELLAAVQARLAAAGIGGLTEAVEIARGAATDAGLADPRVTSDAKHVEIGLRDKSDSARWIMGELWRSGIAPGQVLIAGDELGPLGGLAGSDSNLLVDGATAVSVGVEPNVVPAGVVRLGGGPEMFAAMLEDQIARRRRGELPIVELDPAWVLVVDGVDPLLERFHESLLTLAEGLLGTRGSVIAEHPSGDPAVLMSAVYTRAGAEAHLLAAPRWNTITLDDPSPRPVRRVLDLHAGVLQQQLQSETGQIDALLLSSLARPATAALRVRDRSAGKQLSRPLTPPPGPTIEEGQKDGAMWMRVRGRPGSIVTAARDQLTGTVGDQVLDRVAAYEGAARGPADECAALDHLQCARRLGFDGLLTEHRRAWASRWEDADVVIDGDPELQLAVRFAIFHLLASAPDHGEAAVGARGLSGKGYRGHAFWDSDVYVLPFLAATHPPAARAMLEYRVRRLPAAMRAARAQRRAGARFPWESAWSGQDVTPNHARGRHGELVPILTGPLEEHIIADVAWAAACYIDWTGDQTFAAGPGRELIVQTARWWASRIEPDAHVHGHIRGVIGPDEYHENVDDNAYTNVMARWNLRRAAAAGIGAVDEDELRRWLELADQIVDGYDPSTGIYEQFAGYHALEPLLIAKLAPRLPVAADMLLGHERTQATQVVKQADVLMLHYLIPDEVAAGSLQPNLDFYGPRTAHGSTLSPGVHAALLARAGRLAEALEMLRLAARIDLDDIGHMAAGGLHLAAMGSVWRTLALGFAGLRPAGDALVVDPVLAPGWDTLELRVRFRDSRVRVRVQPGAVEASADPPVAALSPAGDRVQLGRTPQSFPPFPEEESVTTVLAALDSNASGRPVLSTAIALADLFDSTVTCLHVREEALSAAAELARAAGVELREVSGAPVEQIVNAGPRPRRRRARPRRAWHARRLPARRTHRARGHHAHPKAGRRRPTPRATARADRPHPRPARRDQRKLASARRHDQAGSPARAGGLVLHVHSPATLPAFSDHEPHATLAWEREFLSRYISTPHDRITLVRRLGVPADDIVAVARETSPDLIVLAWAQDLAPGHARVVSETLAHTDVPVLLLPVQ
jgi:trehalose/maltose hydrolase-like predicted phosphorylase